jgi:hypothetical protein
VPSPEEYASAITDVDPDNLSFKDSVLFNMPVCDISQTEISELNEEACLKRFDADSEDVR